ncbi:MAG: alpha/beta hydrolase-fold protein [Spirochaetota bacterium]|nr:alpha/beta hydrolase-fold protein [Spirochaetota bacterium]
MRMFTKYIFCIMLLIALQACASQQFQYKAKIISGNWLQDLKIEYVYFGEKKDVPIQIYFPKSYSKGKEYRVLICLHGYNKNMHDWETNTDIENYADTYNFILVCPDMKTTLYELRYYPETTNRWNGIPGGAWIAEKLIPFLRDQFLIALDKNKTGILGYSRGGRGSILIACNYPEIFGAAAGLSGSYDNLSMTNDELLTSLYGAYDEYSERWKKDDNILDMAVNLKETSIFIAHGTKDWRTNYEQSRLFAIRLKQLQKKNDEGYKFEYHEKKYKLHDWKFWKGMLPEMMRFFDENLNSEE